MTHPWPVIAVLVLGMGWNVSAASGPELACTDCGALAHFSEPASGLWFNPDRPGSGMAVQMQNGLLLGTVYTFLEGGEPVWYTFAARPEPMQDAALYTLALRAPLQRYEAGACLECAHAEPRAVADVGHISIEFSQRNHGRFSIEYASGEMGATQHIVPLVAGIELSQDFHAVDYELPNLSGDWAFVLDNPSVPLDWGTEALLFSIRTKRVQRNEDGETTSVEYGFLDFAGLGPSIMESGSIDCRRPSGPNASPIPNCTMDVVSFVPGHESGRLRFPLPIANIGADRIEAVDPTTGVRVKAFRVGFD